MLLQPCEGTQRLSLSPTATTFDLVNDSPEQCSVTGLDGNSLWIEPNSSLSLPVSQRKMTFSVKRGGRAFTVYGEVLPTTGNHENQASDSLLFSTENLINARLGTTATVETTFKSPFARLSSLQNNQMKLHKGLLWKTRCEPGLLKLAQFHVKPEASFDVGLKEALYTVLATAYEPEWFHFALQVLHQLDKQSPKACVFEHCFSNAQIVLDNRKLGAFPENNEFGTRMSKHVLTKVVELIWFLDIAKTSSPRLFPSCLFQPLQQLKSSEQVMNQIGLLIMDGDLVKQLKKAGVELLYKQTAMEEYERKIPSGTLVSKFRDGVLLSLFVQSLIPNITVLPQLRIPVKERLHCITNNEKLLDALERLDPTLLELGNGKISKYDFVDGKKDKILSFIWKLVVTFMFQSVVDETTLWNEVRKVSITNHKSDIWQQTMQSYTNPSNMLPHRMQRLVLYWVQTVCAVFGHIIADFSTMSNGTSLCLLIHYYHPTLLSKDSIYFPTPHDKESEQLRNERRNFVQFNTAIDALGNVPVRLSSHNFKHVLPPPLAFASSAFLAARVLGTSREIRAAQRIQTQWAVRQATRLGTRDSAQKAARLTEAEKARVASEDAAANSGFGLELAKQFFQSLFKITPISPIKLNLTEYDDIENDATRSQQRMVKPNRKASPETLFAQREEFERLQTLKEREEEARLLQRQTREAEARKRIEQRREKLVKEEEETRQKLEKESELNQWEQQRLDQEKMEAEHHFEQQQQDRFEQKEEEDEAQQQFEAQQLLEREEHRLQQELLEREKRLDAQRVKQQRLEQQRLEQQRLAQQRLEQQRLEQQRLEQQRLEQQRLEQQRLEQQRLEQQRLEQQRLEQQRLEQQRLEQLQRQKQQILEQQRSPQRLEQRRHEQQQSQQVEGHSFEFQSEQFHADTENHLKQRITELESQKHWLESKQVELEAAMESQRESIQAKHTQERIELEKFNEQLQEEFQLASQRRFELEQEVKKLKNQVETQGESHHIQYSKLELQLAELEEQKRTNPAQFYPQQRLKELEQELKVGTTQLMSLKQSKDQLEIEVKQLEQQLIIKQRGIAAAMVCVFFVSVCLTVFKQDRESRCLAMKPSTKSTDSVLVMIDCMLNCKRNDANELASLLTLVYKSIKRLKVMLQCRKQELTFVQALVDVLQTFYDQDSAVFSMGIHILQKLCFSKIHHRLQTLKHVLETKIQLSSYYNNGQKRSVLLQRNLDLLINSGF